MEKEEQEEEQVDIIDVDLYEEISDEEMYELIQQGREAILQKEREEKERLGNKRPFPAWSFWLIAFVMVLNIFTLFPQQFSIPAIDFLITSAKLSIEPDIKEYKKAVVVIETGNSSGTGFSISEDGTILTNYHVIEGNETVTVAFPKDGLFKADVVKSYPEIDLAVLEINGEYLPYLTLAEATIFAADEHIRFIGNPLRFQGIANEGTIIDYISLKGWKQEVIMIKAPIYRGNSGSPVINETGQVIGVVFATIDHDTHGRVGLFIPIDYYYEQKEEE